MHGQRGLATHDLTLQLRVVWLRTTFVACLGVACASHHRSTPCLDPRVQPTQVDLEDACGLIDQMGTTEQAIFVVEALGALDFQGALYVGALERTETYMVYYVDQVDCTRYEARGRYVHIFLDGEVVGGRSWEFTNLPRQGHCDPSDGKAHI